MNVLDLPDELLRSVLKNTKFAAVLAARRLNSRINKVARRYQLHKPSLDKLELSFRKMRGSPAEELDVTFRLPQSTSKYMQVVRQSYIRSENAKEEDDKLSSLIGNYLDKCGRIRNVGFRKWTISETLANFIAEKLSKLRVDKLALSSCQLNSNKILEIFNKAKLNQLDLAGCCNDIDWWNSDKICNLNYNLKLSGALINDWEHLGFTDEQLRTKTDLTYGWDFNRFQTGFTVPGVAEIISRILADGLRASWDFGMIEGTEEDHYTIKTVANSFGYKMWPLVNGGCYVCISERRKRGPHANIFFQNLNPHEIKFMLYKVDFESDDEEIEQNQENAAYEDSD